MDASSTTSRPSKAQVSSLKIRTSRAPAAADLHSACKVPSYSPEIEILTTGFIYQDEAVCYLSNQISTPALFLIRVIIRGNRRSAGATGRWREIVFPGLSQWRAVRISLLLYLTCLVLISKAL